MIACRNGKKNVSLSGKKAVALLVSLLLASAIAMTGCATDASSDASSSNQSSSSQSSAAQAAVQDINVTLVVLDPADEALKAADEGVVIEEGATVYDALEASTLDAQIEDSSYGKYLTSMAGTAAEGSSGWVYTVNGEEVMESIDSCVLSDGDTVEFKYITM